MKNLNELKQYVEKELHAKRFLTEALEDINSIENLSAVQKRLVKSIESDTEAANKAAHNLKIVNDKVAAAEEALADVNTQATEIIAAAKDKAAEIIAAANASADEARAAAEQDRKATEQRTKDLLGEEKALNGTIAELKATKNAVEKELDKVRKKLGA